MSEAFERAAVKALASSLDTAVSDFAAVITEWPLVNQELSLPAITIINQPSRLTKKPATYISVGSVTSNSASVLYDVGDFDLEIQIDIWAAYKIQRSRLYDAVFDVLNGNIVKNCYALQLSDYHNQWATFAQIGHEFFNNSEAGSRSEWRAMVRLEVTCTAVFEKTERIITNEPTLVFSTPNEIEES